jgi:RNA polymerase sigma-70 factor (ECF subfamily)
MDCPDVHARGHRRAGPALLSGAEIDVYLRPASPRKTEARVRRPSLLLHHGALDSESTAPPPPPPSQAPNALDDAALLDAMRRGDERAVGTLYDRHSPMVMGLALSIVRDRTDAETVVLDTFTQAWRDAARWDAARGSVASWLLMLARSRALDLLRSSGRRARLAPVSVDDAPPAALVAEDAPSDPARGVEASERQTQVAAALGELPEAQRHAIELAFFEGLSHSEIAERLGEPLGTVKTRIRLGMTKLRQLLRHFGETAGGGAVL